MKRTAFTLLILLPFFLAGCDLIPSLHSICTPENTIFEPALIGVWKLSPDHSETWEFEERENESYLVTSDKGQDEETSLIGRLTMIDETMFLDLELKNKNGLGLSTWASRHLVPAHTFYLVEQIEPTLVIRELSGGWVYGYNEWHPDAVDIAFTGNFPGEGRRYLLTATTEELRRYLGEHTNTHFFERREYVRSAEVQAESSLEPAL